MAQRGGDISATESGDSLCADSAHRTLNGSYLRACGIEDEDAALSTQPLTANKERECIEEGDNIRCVSMYDNAHHHLNANPWMNVSLNSDEESIDDVHHVSVASANRITHQSSRDSADRSLPAPAIDISLGTPLCRICHEDDSEEDLISPCFCSGSMGMLHLSCLETWLGTSDTTKCEICQYQFSISKKRRPIKWYLKNKKLGRDRSYMVGDFMCALCFAPSTIATTFACLIGASYFTSLNKTWEATCLILLATTNLCVFLLWCGFAVRRNKKVWETWKKNHQIIRIKYNPPSKDKLLLHSSPRQLSDLVFSNEPVLDINANSSYDRTQYGEVETMWSRAKILSPPPPAPPSSPPSQEPCSSPSPPPCQASSSQTCSSPSPPECAHASVVRKLLLSSTPVRASNTVDSSTPVHNLREKLMRRWGVQGRAFTPIRPVSGMNITTIDRPEPNMACFYPLQPDKQHNQRPHNAFVYRPRDSAVIMRLQDGTAQAEGLDTQV